MSWIIDSIALSGGAFIVGGVYLGYGASPAMIVAGTLLIALALKAATVSDKNALDRE